MRKNHVLRHPLSESVLGFAYSKDAASTRAYLEAVQILASKHPEKKYLVIAKGDPAEPIMQKAPNLTIIQSKLFSHRMMENLIARSDLAPLVTGDTSISLAIGSMRKGRFFLYDQPPWKRLFVESLVEMMISKMDQQISTAETERLKRMVTLNPESIQANSNVPQEIAQFLEDSVMQEKCVSALTKSLPKMNIFKNVFLIYQAYKFFELELRSARRLPLHVIVPMLIEAGSWKQLQKDLNKIFVDSSAPLMTRVISAVTLEKLGQFQKNPQPLLAFVDTLYAQQKVSHTWELYVLMNYGLINGKSLDHLISQSSAAEFYDKYRKKMEWRAIKKSPANTVRLPLPSETAAPKGGLSCNKVHL